MSTVAGIKYDENNRYHRFARTVVISAISLSLFFLVWWAVSIIAIKPAIPTPLQTWNALVDVYLNGDRMTGISLGKYVSSSMMTFLKGFLLALAVAVPVGLILGYSKLLRDFANPVIEVLRPIAPIAWAPIFILSLGYSTGPILVVFVGIFFPLLTNVVFGVRKIDPNWIDAAKTLGASQLQVFYKVMMPSAIPYVMNGIKIGLGIGWMCIVAAELYATPLGGIGFYLAEQATAGNWPGAYAALVVIAILGLLTIGVADYVHRIISKRMGMAV
ncbi:MAG: ABC transporter permease [Candidatus Methanoplasma sp.]|jgi:NitT/TauT family transport system permease protein|nr:ABC transporter permease [Candidatus Methanoplasma sp.]